MLKLSISNSVFSKFKLQENFTTIKKMGFDNIEFNMKTIEEGDDMSIYPVARLFRDYDLTCLTVHSATLHIRDIVEIHRAIYYAKISVDFAQKLGAPIMVVHSNVSRGLPFDLRAKILKQVFREVQPYAESLGIKLSLENLSYASSGYGKNVEEIEEIFDLIDGDNMGFTLDFCHSTASGTTQSLLEKYHSRLSNIHMSNRSHKPFADETPALKTLVEKLREYEYEGPITLELSRKCSISEIMKTKTVIESITKK